MLEKDNKEAHILKDLKAVHEETLEDAEKSCELNANKISSEEQAEQLKGSDADFDRSIGQEGNNIDSYKEQNNGSDADADQSHS